MKTKFTKELSGKICELISDGNYNKIAAAANGICEDTFYEWIKKYPEFAESVKKANIVSELNLVDCVRVASIKDWKAAMTFLERKFPDRWGRRQRIEHSGPQGGPIDIVAGSPFKDLSLAKKRELIAKIEASNGVGGGNGKHGKDQ